MALNVYDRLRSSFLVLATVPLLIMGCFVGTSVLVREYRLEMNQREQIARRFARSVSTLFLNLEEDLRSAITIRQIADLDPQEQVSFFESMMVRVRGIESVAFILPSGKESIRRSRVSLVRRHDLRDHTEQAWFDIPFNRGESYFGEMYLSPNTGEPLMPLGIPVYDLRSGETRGVLLVEVRGTLVWELLQEEEMRPGEDIFVVSREGHLVAHRISSNVLSGRTVTMPPGERLERGLSGVLVLRATQPMQTGSRTHTVISEIAISQVFYSVILIVIATSVITVFSAAIALVWALREAQSITAPITAIAGAARRIQQAAAKGGALPDKGTVFLHAEQESSTIPSEAIILREALEAMVDNLRMLLEKTRRSLEEREVLLREVHHRVKNNLQVIASLANLQQDRIGTSSSRMVAGTIRRRVYTMALVHMHLHESESLTRIDLQSYISALAHHVLAEGDEEEVRKPISVRCSAGTTQISVDEAGPLGMILGEVLSNCVRHAFSGRTGGSVSIYAATEDESIVVRVEDDGIGLDGESVKACDEDGEGLGMLLVRELTKQLHGKSVFSQNETGGTSFQLTFPQGRSTPP